jgi:hypothetical protein
MFEIKEMQEEDLERFLSCTARIWESLRDHLPDEFVERNLSWNSRQAVRDAWKRAMDDPS